MSRTAVVALAIVGTIAVIVVVLASGGGPQGGPADATDDVRVEEGAGAPADPGPADIAEATVKKIGGEIVFMAVMANDVPGRGSSETLSFRWDLTEDGRETWLVTADLGGRPTAAITSHTSNFGASTIDDTLPGSIEVEGRTVTVSIDAGAVERFPTDFGWILTSTLDADRADPASAVATDTAPDPGPGKVD